MNIYSDSVYPDCHNNRSDFHSKALMMPIYELIKITDIITLQSYWINMISPQYTIQIILELNHPVSYNTIQHLYFFQLSKVSRINYGLIRDVLSIKLFLIWIVVWFVNRTRVSWWIVHDDLLLRQPGPGTFTVTSNTCSIKDHQDSVLNNGFIARPSLNIEQYDFQTF